MKRHAFTLIELLVVVAIITALIAILLPSLGRAQALANMTVCGANERSVGQAMQMYVGDHKYRWYPAVWRPDWTPPIEPVQIVLYDYVGQQKDVYLDPSVIGENLLWDRPDGQDIWLSYGYARGITITNQTPTSVQAPATTFLWACTMNTINRSRDDFVLYGPWWSGFARSIIADWHVDGRGNMLYVDGHVESVISADQYDPDDPLYSGWLYP